MLDCVVMSSQSLLPVQFVGEVLFLNTLEKRMHLYNPCILMVYTFLEPVVHMLRRFAFAFLSELRYSFLRLDIEDAVSQRTY